MGDIQKVSGNLPAEVTALAKGLSNAIAGLGGAHAGKPYAKMDRQGVHVYGPEETEFEDVRVCINIADCKQGYTAWGNKQYGNEGKNVGEVLHSVLEPMPQLDELPDVKGDWSKCIEMPLVVLEGEDKNLECLWKSNSFGGTKAFAKLLDAVLRRIQSGESDFFPIVKLESDSYTHSSYGKIFNPVFEIVGWASPLGEESATESESESEPEPEPEAEKEAPKRTRRRRVKT